MFVWVGEGTKFCFDVKRQCFHVNDLKINKKVKDPEDLFFSATQKDFWDYLLYSFVSLCLSFLSLHPRIYSIVLYFFGQIKYKESRPQLTKINY